MLQNDHSSTFERRDHPPNMKFGIWNSTDVLNAFSKFHGTRTSRSGWIWANIPILWLLERNQNHIFPVLRARAQNLQIFFDTLSEIDHLRV
ncbi:hypothetical protein M413DRAFT_449153 [Hebeloma cylindrosporum]|uniref:Uncharacterized protein n=1 Tax=Hebeloma cylindrosporum TaxID=76867 RepID=A0A0C2Y5W1_HEBCY|nr:hypothetical protein M413DRAFT_449153 [Hebeloma cylindrosporum h7]